MGDWEKTVMHVLVEKSKEMLLLLQGYIFTAAFNRTMVHSLPVLMNIISNLYLRSLNVTESIQVWSNPFFQVSKLI